MPDLSTVPTQQSTSAAFAVTMADFLTNVYVIDTTGVFPPAPILGFFATPAAEATPGALESIGLHPTLTLDWPETGWTGAGPYAQTVKVPYLDFAYPDGSVDHENVAGILTEYLIFRLRPSIGNA